MIETLYATLTAGGSSIVASLLTCYVMQYIFDQRRKKEEKLEAAEADRLDDMERDISELRRDLSTHIQTDQTPVILNELKNIAGKVQTLLDQQQVLLLSDEAQKQQIITLFNHYKELHSGLKECQKEHRK